MRPQSSGSVFTLAFPTSNGPPGTREHKPVPAELPLPPAPNLPPPPAAPAFALRGFGAARPAGHANRRFTSVPNPAIAGVTLAWPTIGWHIQGEYQTAEIRSRVVTGSMLWRQVTSG